MSAETSVLFDAPGPKALVRHRIIAAGFVILTLPMGLFFTWWSRKLAVQR